MEEDFLFALRLQEQFDNEIETSLLTPDGVEEDAFGQNCKKRKVERAEGGGGVPCWKPSPGRPLSIVDESWETLDPNPDVRAMFLEFNDMFFWGKLSGVEVKWSPRMTLCAGVCSYEGRGGLCSIRLSEPLLKLRPRKDLVETLLHEMIHALLFVTQNNRDRDGHGPEFCRHMNRINEASGTKITIYHSFHDEVDVYRQHWWRCDGPCQNRKPYFGYVKRAMNRAPSALDPWWEDHRRTCGGAYLKVKEPEGYGKKGKKDSKKEGKNLESKATAKSAGSGLQDIRNIIPFSGRGFLLGGNSQSCASSAPSLLSPVANTCSSSTISSPMLVLSSPTRTLVSPVRSSFADKANGSPPVAGLKPPVKRSVGNCRAFVNISGSPVKIPKTRGNANNKDAKTTQQKSIEDLFSLRKPSETAAVRSASGSCASATATPSSSTSGGLCSAVVRGTQRSPAEPTDSPGFNHSSSSSSSSSASRKRSWDVHSTSASVSAFFQKTISSDSSPTIKPPAVQHTGAAAAFTGNSRSVQSSSVPCPPPSATLAVACPVCHAKVPESQINEHLDACLS
ncbi:sprT-like domain-containing protein Spartan isoform X2 [Takifugu rubripes]|uniref:sprT-like domain-containing protein Spartan isoform X2 n=1 Tax=Takifugu rubripes TaxID=31033 RepID=UPI0011455E55|nr:sprT-like domain-containing protein Spartan isoform X2 [Takifugu rubripes]